MADAVERCECVDPGKRQSDVANFRNLRVWQTAQALAVDVYRVSERMRGTRGNALRDQLTRAAVSVPTNIVEGSAHESPREFARFLRYSLASVSEVEGHLQLSRDLGMVTEADYAALLSRVVAVRMMLHGLLKSLTIP